MPRCAAALIGIRFSPAFLGRKAHKIRGKIMPMRAQARVGILFHLLVFCCLGIATQKKYGKSMPMRAPIRIGPYLRYPL